MCECRHGLKQYGTTVDVPRQLPWKLSGESYDGSGPAVPNALPLSSSTVDARGMWPGRGYDPDNLRGNRPSASRIPQGRPTTMGDVPPVAVDPIRNFAAAIQGRTGKGSWFGRFRRSK